MPRKNLAKIAVLKGIKNITKARIKKKFHLKNKVFY